MVSRLGNVLLIFGVLVSLLWYGLVAASYYGGGPVIERGVMAVAVVIGAFPFLIGLALSHIFSGN